MAVVKKLLLGLFVLPLAGTSVQAAPMSWPGGSWRWTTWVSNRSLQGNGGYSISGPSSFNPFVAPPPSNPETPPQSYSSGTLSLVPSNVAAPAPQAPASYSISSVSVPTSSVNTFAAPVSEPSVSRVGTVDAYINLGNGPFADANSLTTGGAQPWYYSPTAINAFGGVPDAQQQSSFSQSVLQRVQQTFQLSGLNPSLTLDASVPALHTLSVVSNSSNGADSNAIGMTEIGGNGFGYLDKLSSLNFNADQLAWAVAHNVAHELMHAFGVGSHPDQSGNFLDSASATQSVLTDPNTTFSPAAVQLMKESDFGANMTGVGVGAQSLDSNSNHVGSQCCCVFCHGLYGGHSVNSQLLEAPVPEPATIFVWGVAMTAAWFGINRKRNANSLKA